MGTTPSISSVALPVIPSQFWDNINTLHPTAMKFINKNEKQDGGLYYAPNRVALQDSGGGYFASTQTSAVVTASQSSDLLPEQFNWVHVINDMLITYDQQVRQGELGEFARAGRDEVDEQQRQPAPSRLPQRGKAVLVGVCRSAKERSAANP